MTFYWLKSYLEGTEVQMRGRGAETRTCCNHTNIFPYKITIKRIWNGELL